MTSHHGLHSCRSAEHYTPAPYIAGARAVLATIDLDPASSAAANKTVQATRFYTAEDDGLALPWGGGVYLNPPGDRRGVLIKAFWRRACEHALYGGPGAAALWAGYSLGPLPRLAQCEAFDDGRICPGPTNWPMVIIGPTGPFTTGSGRICWIQGQTGEPGRQPGHGNYFCLLGGDAAMRARFQAVFGRWGSYVAPTATPRNLSAEILALVANGRYGSKSAIARAVRARRSDVFGVVDQLEANGALRRRDGIFAVPRPGTASEIKGG